MRGEKSRGWGQFPIEKKEERREKRSAIKSVNPEKVTKHVNALLWFASLVRGVEK